MGYDFILSVKENSCEFCSRYSRNELCDMYVSYNHAWAFYKYLDKDSGLRWIYGKPVTEIILPLKKMIDTFIAKECHDIIPTHETDLTGEIAWSDKKIMTSIIHDIHDNWKEEHEVQDDGWATTFYNAYRCANEILQYSMLAIENGQYTAVWNGD
jgi:hypothetical protein